MTASPIQSLTSSTYKEIKASFLEELRYASHAKPSSLSWIIHHLPKQPLLTHGIVQGIVIGGTNFLFSTEGVESNGRRKMITKKTGSLPTFTTEAAFIEFMREHLDPSADAIGINFGFPLAPITGSFGQLDGKLLYGTKEHRFAGLTQPIGHLLQELLFTICHKTIPVSVANDTICLLASGDGTEQAALIEGTGINIGLVQNKQGQKTLINLEAGNFNHFAPSAILEKLDAASEVPGGQLFEKAIAGKYLSQYFNAQKDTLHLTFPPIMTTKELSALSLAEHENGAGDLARSLLTSSAYMLAAALAALYEFSGSPDHFTIIGEGSLLWKGWNYQNHIQENLGVLGVPEQALTIKHVKDSSTNGAIGLITT